jgi:hypothetical protein
LISSESNTVDCSVSVGGTVGYVSTANPGGLIKEYYNFAAGTFYFDHISGLMTDPANYSTTGTAPAASTQNTEAQTAAQSSADASASSSTSTSTAASDEYDDVPKTGESNLIIWLFVISGACLTGRFALKKSM